MNRLSAKHKVIAFDVFGTVVDWYSSVKNYIESLNLGIDSNAFTLDWRKGYQPAMKSVMESRKWVKIDDLHLQILTELLEKYEINSLTKEQIEQLNKVWHQLIPWKDSVSGLTELKKKYIICTLSNGNISLLTNMAKYSNLPWDCILSAELFLKYKPHKDTYLGVAKIFDVQPKEVLMVATHISDLDAAKLNGLSTAYIERPKEFGEILKEIPKRTTYDYYASSITELNQLLIQ